MVEYIEREKVLAKKTEIHCIVHCQGADEEDVYNAVLVEDINAIPAADVRPVKRGEWSRIDYKPHGHDYQCSVCQFKNDEPNNFCPNCGADMREKEET